jgi:hypothetical protein
MWAVAATGETAKVEAIRSGATASAMKLLIARFDPKYLMLTVNS